MRILILLLGTAGNALIAFLTHLLLTRNVPVSDYGHVVSVTAAVTMLTPIAGMTIGWFWLELYGREGRAAVRWGKASRKAAALAFLVSFAVLLAYLAAAGLAGAGSAATVFACACLMLAGQTLADARAVRLQLEERYFHLALWQVTPQALRSSAVLVLMSAAAISGQTVMLGYAAAGLVGALLSYSSVRALTDGTVNLPGKRQMEHAQEVGDSAPNVHACLRAAWPFSLVTLFYLVYSTGILALVSPLIGAQASAYYNVGFLIFNSLAMLPSVVYSKYLAGRLFRWWSHDQDKFVAAFHLGVAVHGCIGVVLGACMWFGAPLLVPLLFGESYRAAVAVVQILALAVPIRFVQHGYGSVLFSQDHIRRKVAYMGQAAALSVLLMILLAPAYGVTGAAASAVAAELALLVLYMLGAARHVGPIDVRATLSLRTLSTAYRRLAR
ncbi:lipopolysaccharide biosynthesis protein [Massilia sp. LXY-6]|uniref:lipopolysaccharide biosynthesis protein n=1 Tax=Massilia sp. LXY-6 TaxID=3379823 RepID=UPI003EE2A02E